MHTHLLPFCWRILFACSGSTCTSLVTKECPSPWLGREEESSLSLIWDWSQLARRGCDQQRPTGAKRQRQPVFLCNIATGVVKICSSFTVGSPWVNRYHPVLGSISKHLGHVPATAQRKPAFISPACENRSTKGFWKSIKKNNQEKQSKVQSKR